MIRTQVSLDKQEYERVKKEARALGISIAEVIRRAVRDSIPGSEDKPWIRFAGSVQSGDPAASRSVDDIVYGAKD